MEEKRGGWGAVFLACCLLQSTDNRSERSRADVGWLMALNLVLKLFIALCNEVLRL
jgi:hypothetical protein